MHLGSKTCNQLNKIFFFNADFMLSLLPEAGWIGQARRRDLPTIGRLLHHNLSTSPTVLGEQSRLASLKTPLASLTSLTTSILRKSSQRQPPPPSLRDRSEPQSAARVLISSLPPRRAQWSPQFRLQRALEGHFQHRLSPEPPKGQGQPTSSPTTTEHPKSSSHCTKKAWSWREPSITFPI